TDLLGAVAAVVDAEARGGRALVGTNAAAIKLTVAHYALARQDAAVAAGTSTFNRLLGHGERLGCWTLRIFAGPRRAVNPFPLGEVRGQRSEVRGEKANALPD